MGEVLVGGVQVTSLAGQQRPGKATEARARWAGEKSGGGTSAHAHSMHLCLN